MTYPPTGWIRGLLLSQAWPHCAVTLSPTRLSGPRPGILYSVCAEWVSGVCGGQMSPAFTPASLPSLSAALHTLALLAGSHVLLLASLKWRRNGDALFARAEPSLWAPGSPRASVNCTRHFGAALYQAPRRTLGYSKQSERAPPQMTLNPDHMVSILTTVRGH